MIESTMKKQLRTIIAAITTTTAVVTASTIVMAAEEELLADVVTTTSIVMTTEEASTETATTEEEAISTTEDAEVEVSEAIIIVRQQDIMIGDADYNEKLDIEDASIILTYYAHNAAGILEEFPDMEIVDVNQNGGIDIDDAVLVLEYYAKSAASLEAEWPPIAGVTTTTTIPAATSKTTTSTTTTVETTTTEGNTEYEVGDILLFFGSEEKSTWSLRSSLETGSSNNIVTDIEQGTKIQLLERVNSIWYKVKYNGDCNLYAEIDPDYFVKVSSSAVVSTTTISTEKVESTATTTVTTNIATTTTKSSYAVGTFLKCIYKYGWNIRSEMTLTDGNESGSIYFGEFVKILQVEADGWYVVKNLSKNKVGYIKVQIPNNAFEIVDEADVTTVDTSTTTTTTTTTSTTSTTTSTTSTTTSTRYDVGTFLKCVHSEGWRIREDTDLNSSVVIQIDAGDVVEVVGVLEDSWYYVNHLKSEHTGFMRIIKEHEISFEETTISTTEDAFKMGDVVTFSGDSWNVRSSVGGTVIDSVNTGESFLVLYKVRNYSDWYAISVDEGIVGFVQITKPECFSKTDEADTAVTVSSIEEISLGELLQFTEKTWHIFDDISGSSVGYLYGNECFAVLEIYGKWMKIAKKDGSIFYTKWNESDSPKYFVALR